jgi:hypothetical protein
MVRIVGSHPADPGSSPGMGNFSLSFFICFKIIKYFHNFLAIYYRNLISINGKISLEENKLFLIKST